MITGRACGRWVGGPVIIESSRGQSWKIRGPPSASGSLPTSWRFSTIHQPPPTQSLVLRAGNQSFWITLSRESVRWTSSGISLLRPAGCPPAELAAGRSRRQKAAPVTVSTKSRLCIDYTTCYSPPLTMRTHCRGTGFQYALGLLWGIWS